MKKTHKRLEQLSDLIMIVAQRESVRRAGLQDSIDRLYDEADNRMALIETVINRITEHLGVELHINEETGKNNPEVYVEIRDVETTHTYIRKEADKRNMKYFQCAVDQEFNALGELGILVYQQNGKLFEKLICSNDLRFKKEVVILLDGLSETE